MHNNSNMWHNKKYIFHLCSVFLTGFLNSWNFLLRVTGAYFVIHNKLLSTIWVYANKVTLGRNSYRVGVGCQRNFQSHPQGFLGRRNGQEIGLVTNGKWFNQPRLHNETIKHLKWWATSKLINTSRRWEGVTPRKGMGTLLLLPNTTPCQIHLFYLAVPEL